MSGAFPRFLLYEEDGTTLVYEFDAVTDWSPDPLQDPERTVIHESLRGQGGIVIPGSSSPWDFTLTFRLSDDSYEGLFTKMESAKNTILFNTKYILKIDKTIAGATIDLKVKRLSPINYPITNDRSKVVTSQQGIITFKINVWS